MVYSDLFTNINDREAAFLSVLSVLPQGLLLCESSGRIVFVNNCCKEILQLPPNYDLEKNTLFDFIAENNRNEIRHQISELKETNKVVSFVKTDGNTFLAELNLQVPVELAGKLIVVTLTNLSEQKKAEIKLNEELKKYRLLTESMNDVIWSADANMIVTYISPSDNALRGFEKHEVIGKSILDMIPCEFQDILKPMITDRRNRINSGERVESIAFESEIYCKDGSTIWVEILSNPIFDSEGVFMGFQGIARDIRLRKEMENALREADERYRTVVSTAPIVLFEIDMKGIFRLSEGGALSKIGLKPGEVVGISAFEVYKDFPDICDQVRRALNGEFVNEKIQINGVVFDIYYHPVITKRKKITSTIGIAVEITDKAKTEQLLIESEEKFRSLFESMSEGVALHDLVFNDNGELVNYRINDVNPAYEKHTGLDFSDARGKLATEVYGTVNPPYFKEFSDVAITGKPFHYETYFPPLERYFRISVVCTGKNRFATVFEDITSTKNREKELKNKNEELERFTYTVSHDLRSPLVTIKGFIGMLQQDIAAGSIEAITDDIRRISMAADKMTDLLNDLLELSQIGRIINPPVFISMKQIVDETLELLTGIITEKKVEIKVAEDLPMVYVDKQRLGEVWQNLIENAVKFITNQPNPVIEIGYFSDYGENVFFISDNGQGIDPKYHETIFGLFNKLDSKTSGTGIGLSLVSRIIDIHGGRIWVESEGTGKGSTFKFTIPNKV
jgi:PAS domain S-box-containing protein